MKGKRAPRVLGALSCICIIGPVLLALWTARTEAFAHYRPEYAQVDLQPILRKEILTEEDYSLLYLQTGLARAGVDELCASGRQEELLCLQQRLFDDAEVVCLHNNLFIRSERLADSVVPGGGAGELKACSDNPEGQACTEKAVAYDVFPTIQTGDILITFSGHVFGWRSGHAAIVINAEKRLTLEAITLGCDSRICSLDDWEEYPSVAVLRLKGASPWEREQIAAYAMEYLQGLPYRLTAFAVFDGGDGLPSGAAPMEAVPEGLASVGTGIFPKNSLTGTQCAHLVWYAYRNFGYNLDSDGGFVVTPEDIYRSKLLEIVQIYGISPNY